MKLVSSGYLLLPLLALSALAFSARAKVNFSFELTELTDELKRPWAIAALPDRRLVITERQGALRLFDGKRLSKPISGFPSVYNADQGGLLDVKADPEFARNQRLYFTYSAGSATNNRTVLARARLVKGKLSQFKVLFEAKPNKKQAYHFAGRIEFLPDNTLVFGVGDGSFYKEEAQNLSSHLGSIIRLNDDGSVPADNPFVLNKNAKPEVYSYGHRNPQGLYFDKKRNLLFSNEHGPKGGDEINILEPGKNYGWPTITYGVNYDGSVISNLTHKFGMEQPVLQWTPSIAPSSIQVYYGNAFPQLSGHILTTTLKYQELRLVELKDKGSQVEVVGQQTFLKNKGERLRDIEVDAKGRILLITDSGKLWRLSRPTL